MLHQLHEEAQKPLIIQSMLASIRERFALGSPPKDSLIEMQTRQLTVWLGGKRTKQIVNEKRSSVNAARSQLPR